MVLHRHLDFSENHLPIEDDWWKAYRWTVLCCNFNAKMIKSNLTFDDFMNCVLFLIEAVGIKKINSAYDLFFHLKELYSEKKNDKFGHYPKEIFESAWKIWLRDKVSIASDYFFKHCLIERENDYFVLCLGRVGSQPRQAWADFCENLEKRVFPKFKSPKNAKYLPCIMQVARDLVEVLKIENHR